jgi:CheY-like chemotaxis protein/serine phosphatase RsbU (regulator of sigma subunit)/anti-sigma regulatory factor (Ser/Thr protein kinase)
MSDAMCILVADDNEGDRMLLSAIVRREGYDVITAVDGVDALAKFEAEAPDIVLLDALMPNLDGFDAAREIKARTKDAFIPIVFLTSLTEAGELARCLDAGGDDFLSKPYNPVILRAKLAALARMRQLHNTLAAQRDEIAMHHARLMREQDAAKDIFDRVAHSGCLSANVINYMMSPLAVFNGDILLAAQNPAGNMYILVGDFTGHGLTASIGAMPLAEIFYGMTPKGFGMCDVLREINRKLKEILPVGYFCCATMIDMNFNKGTVEVWAGGLPDAYLYRADSARVTRIRSRHLPLGVASAERFDASTEVYELAPGDRILMCTDGVLEVRNAAGEMYGADRLEVLLGSLPQGAQAFESVKAELDQHMGSAGREDDITVIEVTMRAAQDVVAPAPKYVVKESPSPRDWTLTYELRPDSLKHSNPLPILQNVLTEVPSLRARGSAIFTVLSELYTNALEHGVMGLRSETKSSANGFAQYYSRRADVLKTLDRGYVRFELRSRSDARGGHLNIRVLDSGEGFDAARVENAEDVGERGGYHGRGIGLVRELTDSLTFRGKGNDVEAVLRWGDGACDDERAR